MRVPVWRAMWQPKQRSASSRWARQAKHTTKSVPIGSSRTGSPRTERISTAVIATPRAGYTTAEAGRPHGSSFTSIGAAGSAGLGGPAAWPASSALSHSWSLALLRPWYDHHHVRLLAPQPRQPFAQKQGGTYQHCCPLAVSELST